MVNNGKLTSGSAVVTDLNDILANINMKKTVIALKWLYCITFTLLSTSHAPPLG